MSSDDQPIMVYNGQPGDVVFLRSLMDADGIEVIAAGVFFGATTEIYVRRCDEADAREIVADFESQRIKANTKGNVLRGPWSTD